VANVPDGAPVACIDRYIRTVGYGQEILDGLWRFTTVHPEWEDDSDGWEPVVAWWAIQTERGLLLVDPLVDDWDELDELVAHGGGCAGVVRTLHWHQRTIPAVAERYAVDVWARPWDDPRERPAGSTVKPYDRPIKPGRPLPGDVLPFDAAHDDEIILWSGPQQALVFGDVLIRDADGTLRVCPNGWIERAGGPERIKAELAELLELDVRHALVAHGPLVLGDGAEALAAALSP
jgi:hypothetical protein